MKIRKHDGAIERRVLIGMITSTPVLGRVSSRWERGLFASDWANVVGEWCVDFYRKAGKAPDRSIAALHEEWAADQRDEATSRIVAAFLESLSDEHERDGKVNVNLLIDLAGKHFDLVRLKRAADAITAHVEAGDVEKAWKAYEDCKRAELGAGAYVEPLNDEEVINAAFATDDEPDLVEYGGALGEFFHRQLRRGCFVACMAPEKYGKSHGLLDIMLTAVVQRNRVAYFECGDMTQDQIIMRLASKVAGRPTYAKKWPAVENIPVGITRGKEDKTATVESEEAVFDEPLSVREALEALRDLRFSKVRSNSPYLRLSCYPNGTLSVVAADSVLDTWKSEGWDADVVIFDYADLLCPPKGIREPRDQVNEIWKSLRAMSQKRHCLVVTATQANGASYTAELLGRHHYANDKRKYAHTTGVFGLNMTPDEKENNQRRYNWLVRREGKYSIKRCVHVAGCLAINAPNMISCW